MDAIYNTWNILRQLELPLVSVTDIVEILILTVIIYYILVWVQNTKAWFLIKGIVALLLIYCLASLLQLNTIRFLMTKLANVALIGAVIVFQPELRKGLEQLGKGHLFQLLLSDDTNPNAIDGKTVDELVRASFSLAQTRTGALVVIERELSLEEYIRTGIVVDAVVTSPLLINIFEHNTPLHDGAVVMRGNRIVAATCYLPLSQNNSISKELGTRHRAAIGVSEVTDSLTVVVSEETGDVSVAEQGKISRGLTPDELRKRLSVLIDTEDDRQKQRPGLHLRKGRQKNS